MSDSMSELIERVFDKILPIPKTPRVYRPPTPPKTVSWAPRGSLKNDTYVRRLKDFAQEIKAIDARRTKRIKYSSRGWCYLFEGLGLIDKGEFSKVHIWVNSSGAVGAFKLQNLGGKDILLDKISVRGVDEAWTDVWFYRVPADTGITGDMNRTGYATLTGSPDIDGKNYTQASGDIPLVSGGELLVYIKGPDNVQLDDLGTGVSISVHTNNAQYITEVNVESLTSQ